jgi:hypothetical protein
VWFALALFLLAGVLVYRAFPAHRRVAQPEFAPVPAAAFEAPVRPALERRVARPVYPYSVIRGGAYSVAELDAALDHDPVASAHYAAFHRDALRMTIAPGPWLMYASYRMGGSVYWTSHPVHVAAGESLITDGTSLARARCGNQLSDSPREPVTRMEPMEREMETPATLALNPALIPVLNPVLNPDFNPAAVADTRALDRLLALRPQIAPPVSALAFEIFPPAPLSAAGASLGSATVLPFGARSSLSLPAPVSSPPAEYSPPPAGGSGESSLQLTLQTFQQKPASTTVVQVPQVNPPVLPGVITGIEGFPGDYPLDPAVPSNHPAPPATTSSSLPPITGDPEPGDPSPSPSPGESVPATHVVPEPVAGALLCAGVALLYIAKRRRAL